MLFDVRLMYATISKNYEQFYQNSGDNCDGILPI